MRIAVIGATGQTGPHVVRGLVESRPRRRRRRTRCRAAGRVRRTGATRRCRRHRHCRPVERPCERRRRGMPRAASIARRRAGGAPTVVPARRRRRLDPQVFALWRRGCALGASRRCGDACFGHGRRRAQLFDDLCGSRRPHRELACWLCPAVVRDPVAGRWAPLGATDPHRRHGCRGRCRARAARCARPIDRRGGSAPITYRAMVEACAAALGRASFASVPCRRAPFVAGETMAGWFGATLPFIGEFARMAEDKPSTSRTCGRDSASSR